jgi:hypothetical protein
VAVSAAKEVEKKDDDEQSLFTFAAFDVETVMKRGAVLVASGGQVRRVVSDAVLMATGIRRG